MYHPPYPMAPVFAAWNCDRLCITEEKIGLFVNTVYAFFQDVFNILSLFIYIYIYIYFFLN